MSNNLKNDVDNLQLSNQDRVQFWQETNQYCLFASTPNFKNWKIVLWKLNNPSMFITKLSKVKQTLLNGLQSSLPKIFMPMRKKSAYLPIMFLVITIISDIYIIIISYIYRLPKSEMNMLLFFTNLTRISDYFFQWPTKLK
jgi:hypothetical protein